MGRGCLIVESGRLKGQTFALGEGQNLAIGRGVHSDIQIPDNGVSRLHCRISQEGGEYFLLDLGSSNGTMVNGESATRRALAEGDLIGVGSSTLRFTLEEERRDRLARGERNTTVDLVGDSDTVKGLIRKKYNSHTASLAAREGETPLLSRTRKSLEAVCDMAGIINSEVAIDTILSASADAVLRVTGADRSAIVLADPATGEPRPVACRFSDPAASGVFQVSRTILDEALRQGVSVISSDAATDDRFKGGASVMFDNLHGVMCAPVTAEERVLGAIYVDSASAAALFSETELGLLAAIGHQVGVALERARLVEDLERLFVGSMHTLIATIEAKDAYTRGHSERVTCFALMIADALGLSGAEREVVELGGVLHDVGKIAVPEAVLLKPDKLTDEEFEVIKRHPADGRRIMDNMPQLDRIVSIAEVGRAVLHHHERYDGRGYPGGLAGAAIPRAARILAVADTYDAITSNRPYRQGRDGQAAARIIDECSGSQFDPEVAQAFIGVCRSGRAERPEGVEWRFRLAKQAAFQQNTGGETRTARRGA